MPTILQRITYTLKRRWVRQTPRRDQQIKIRSCQYHPHKHVLPSLLTSATVSDFKLGYPNLATFKNSSEAFSIYRRFGYLQSRLLLEKQDVLRVLEQRLDQYDREHVTTSYTRTLKADELMPRQALLEEIEHAFNSYGRSAEENLYEITRNIWTDRGAKLPSSNLPSSYWQSTARRTRSTAVFRPTSRTTTHCMTRSKTTSDISTI